MKKKVNRFLSVWDPELESSISQTYKFFALFALLGTALAVLRIILRFSEVGGAYTLWKLFFSAGFVFCGWFLWTGLHEREGRQVFYGKFSRLLRLLRFGFGTYGVGFLISELISQSYSTLYGLFFITTCFVVTEFEVGRKKLKIMAHFQGVQKTLFFAGIFLVISVTWLETTKLAFWEPLSASINLHPNYYWKAILLALLTPIFLLMDLGDRSRTWRRAVFLSFDLTAILVFIFVCFRKDILLRGYGDYNLPVFLAPVDYIRSGGALLWDVPSQYGFLNILTVAVLKFWTPLEAFYFVNSSLIFLGTLISYIVFRWAWPSLFAPLIGIPFILAANIYMPGWAPNRLTPLMAPSTGPFRFIACYLLGLILFLQFRNHAARKNRLVILFV